jgi:hypothetical protein
VTESLAPAEPTAPALPPGTATVTPAQATVIGAAAATPVVPITPYVPGADPTGQARASVTRALHEYNTNGAGVAAVPTEGLAGQYFSNGAAVLSAPSSVIPESSFDVNFDMPAQPSP